jgi:hypothetical protein
MLGMSHHTDPPKCSLNVYSSANHRILVSHSCTQSNNLIPGITIVYNWVVESGTFGHVPICIYMSYRPNEFFIPKQQKKRYVSISDKNLEQHINIKFSVKIDESVIEMLTLLTLA